MKIKFIYTFILGLISCAICSQEKITQFKNSLKISSSDIKDVIPIVDNINNETAIFIADAKNIYGYKFDDNFKLIEKLSSERKKRKYKILLGSSINASNDYTIFISNKNKDKFAAVNFTFKSDKSTLSEFKLPIGEKFIQTISYNNKFYMIAGSKLKNGLYVYEFNNHGKPKKNTIDHSNLSFVNKSGNSIKLINLFTEENPFKKVGPLKKFEENTPNSIESVASSRKMYLKKNKILFTFDINKEHTQILIVDIDHMSATNKTFPKPLEKTRSSRKKTNSFIHDHNFFSVASTKDTFSMYITNYNTGKLIKKFNVNKDEKINFKNTPIIQEGGFYNGHRKLEKTKKFLRKISSNKIGLLVTNQDNTYHITIGGYVEQRSAGGGMMMGGFGAIGGTIGGVNVFFNPTMLAYNSFTNTKSTRIECLFDNDFNHIKDGEIKENAFDKMKKSVTKNKAASTVFKYNDYFIKGDYNTFNKTYTLVKYSN